MPKTLLYCRNNYSLLSLSLILNKSNIYSRIEQETEIKFRHIIQETPQNEQNFLDYCIKNLKAFLPSRNSVKKAIKRKDLLANDNPIIWNHKVTQGDIITLKPQEIKHKEFVIDLPIIYEDEYFAIINKPAGYPVSGNSFKTIQNALKGNIKKSSLPDALPVPRPVHRLDLQTSGLLVIAKNNTSAMNLGKQFEERTVSKTYSCIVKGNFPEKISSDEPINDLDAFTEFELEKAIPNKFLGNLSLINAKPKTGRQHQIRIHTSNLGFPILGDKVYGEYFNKGLFLFAKKLELKHPETQKIMKFELELPNKFQNILKHTSDE